MKKVLFSATVDSHILQFHIPYLKMLKEQGYEVHVATNGMEKIPYCDVKHVISFERSPIKINNLKAIKDLRKIIEKEQFDFIHCHTPMGSVVTRLAAKKARKKYHTEVFYTAHGFHFFKGASVLNWLIYYPIEKWLSQYTDTLITINQEDYERAKKHFKMKHIELIHGVGIDENKFDFKMTEEEIRAYRKTLGLGEEDFVILYVAELTKRKNQRMLIKAVKELTEKEQKDIKVILAGTDSRNGYYQKMAKKLGVQENIKFLGYRKDVPQLLKISDLYVSTAKQEGLPVNIMEAMFSGLPIIATNCRGNRDLIQDGKNGFMIEMKDEKKLIHKIELLKTDKQLAVKMKKENDWIKQKYVESKIKSQVNAIYHRKMKVLHVLNSNQYSGAENVVCTIIENMSDCAEMVYCSPRGNIGKILAKRNIRYRGLEKLTRKNLKKILNEEKPDIIHAHDFRASIISASVIKKEQLISHIHQNPDWMRKCCLYSLIYLTSSLKYNHIIVVSKHIQEEYRFHKLIEKKMIVLENPIDIRKIEELAGTEKSPKYDMMYLGRLSSEKNPLEFIQIVKSVKEKIPKIKVVMVGDGELREECKNKIKALGLEKNIEMKGFLENPYPVLKQSKILCVTSKWEGFGLVVVEAMALRKVVVAKNISTMSEKIDETCGKLYHNKEEASEEIIKLLLEENYYSDKQKNIKIEIEDMEHYKRKYCDILYKNA